MRSTPWSSLRCTEHLLRAGGRTRHRTGKLQRAPSEAVLAQARVCRFCRYEFSPLPLMNPATGMLQDDGVSHASHPCWCTLVPGDHDVKDHPATAHEVRGHPAGDDDIKDHPATGPSRSRRDKGPMPQLVRRDLISKRTVAVAGVLALLSGVSAAVQTRDLVDSLVNVCAALLRGGDTDAQLPGFCFGDTVEVSALKAGAEVTGVYFLVILGVLSVGRLVWRMVRGRSPKNIDRIP